MTRFRIALLFSFLVLGAGGCDNVGRAFGPNTPADDGGGAPGESAIAVVPVGGDTRDGRPKVRAAFPEGAGWPTTVPIVIQFSESLNQDSILPTTPTGTDARIVLRVQGTTQALPCQYDFVANGRVLVMRPVTALSNAQQPTYEVVMLPDGRDADGVRFLVDGDEQLLTDFQVNQATSFTDGRILAVYPPDNARDVTREADFFVFFDRPANEASFTAANLRLRRRGGADVGALATLPLTTVGVNDARIVRLRPQDRLQGSTTHEFVCDDTVTFGTDGTLDFRGRTPFASFDTVGPAAPATVVLGNPTPTTFPNKINQMNVGSPVLNVTTAVDAAAGDRIVARIYGGNAETAANTADLMFVERSAVVPAAGPQIVTIDFSGLLGTLQRPKVDDGELTFTAQTQRGSEHSGTIHHDGDTDAAFDITLPTLSRAGPPSGADSDVVTDQESLAYFGTASEAVGEVRLAVDGIVSEADLFAAADDGRFLLKPLTLGLQPTPRNYSLTLRDRAGNLATAAVTGQVVQRGLVSGTVAGTLTVEVYDQRTLQPVVGARVLVDPGVPVVPAVGRLTGTTGNSGRAEFTGLVASSHTITVVQPGFHLVTLYDSGGAFASLPLRPIGNATATLRGNALFTQAANTTVLVGSTAFDDPNTFAVRTTDAAPTTIPATNTVPNRPAIVTAFGGTFEPTAAPTFTLQGFQSLGTDGMSLAPPLLPPVAGSASDQNLVLLPSTGQFGRLFSAVALDFGLATGLDLGNLVGGLPIVRVAASLRGFGGQALMGVGWSQPPTGTLYDVNANWTLPGFVAFTPFGANSAAWVVADARDTGGRVSRVRVLYDTVTGLTSGGAIVGPLAIPTVTTPLGPSVGPPSVEFADVLDRASIVQGVGTVDLVAEDAAGRRWTLWIDDADAATGTDTVQFPDVSGAGVPGLQAGAWTVRPESRLWVTVTGATSEYVLAERRRVEFAYARAAATTFTIQ